MAVIMALRRGPKGTRYFMVATTTAGINRETDMHPIRIVTLMFILSMPALLRAAPPVESGIHPTLDHVAVSVMDLDKTATFLNNALGWNRHPLEFSIGEDSKVFKVFGGMKLAFVDANGAWLELVEPTTPGRGMDLLRDKGKGSFVEFDFSIGHTDGDFEKRVAALRRQRIEPIGMDGKPVQNDGRSSLCVLKENKRQFCDERLVYVPPDVSLGTAVELYWEYPSGVVLLRDATWTDTERSPRTGPRIDHVVMLAADLGKTTMFYSDVLGLKRHSSRSGLPRDWMSVGDDGDAWIEGNGIDLWIDVVSPASSGPGAALLKSTTFGDGAIMEIGVEVANVDAFYDRMKAKGITMTAANDTPLPAGKKAVAVERTGDSYSYFPLNKSEGMRIMVFQRGPKATSSFYRRNGTANR
jgi:catechol 2,3-dioxygenase-like lactoylglutathione lyase family enzyme